MENLSAKSSSSGGPTISNSDCDTEEQDEPSSSPTQNQVQVEDVLADFRENWQRELRSPLHQHPTTKTKNIGELKDANVNEFENNARILFLKGIEMEKAGKLYEAIQFYRRAVQIVPDIEFKLDNISKPKLRERLNTDNSEDGNEESSDQDTEDNEQEIIEEGQLLVFVQKKLAKTGTLCIPKFEQKTTHISVLPVEILLYILRWLVSADLDLRSLEVFGMACRGFYLCARDPEIWRLSCLRIWGLNCGCSPGIYGSWRNMFIERARLHFNGCYISKTTYIRHGENNFQDQFYRPWHLVAYYRYIRFFPEGLVLMLTSPEEPSQCVGQMKNRNARQPVMTGYYRLKDDKVTIVVQRLDNKLVQNFKRNSKKREIHDCAEQTFHMEFQIRNHRKRRHIQLVWTHYSVFNRSKKGDESTCNFDLLTNRFPPLWFSRVKSYTAESEFPLA